MKIPQFIMEYVLTENEIDSILSCVTHITKEAAVKGDSPIHQMAFYSDDNTKQVTIVKEAMKEFTIQITPANITGHPTDK